MSDKDTHTYLEINGDFRMRELDHNDLEQFNALLQYAFQVTSYELFQTGWEQEEIKYAKRPILEDAYVLGWFYKEKLASMIVVYSMQINIQDNIMAMGGITGVTTYPEYTGRGLIHSLMRYVIDYMIALHYVFDSPKDKIVYDVSHQSYPHKMLTGRKDAYLYEEKYDDVSGYSNPHESEHDFFTVGHTSTSVSLAAGLAKARDLKGEDGNIIAVIGDGSLSGGEALEGLDYAAELSSNFIIVVNDNDMSIAENHGGLYQNLKLLRETNGQAECNLFKAFGLDYIYVDKGNDTAALIDAFKQVKDSKKPIVVHINTLKGKGYAPAEQKQGALAFQRPL